MDISSLFNNTNEKPLDTLIDDGGFCGTFRTIGCVGDSLSSGEFESLDENGKIGWHDFYEYSWGQFMARTVGCKVYNFSRGGMTAKEYCETFASDNNFWDSSMKCQAYIIALGVNDRRIHEGILGEFSDIDFNDWRNSKKTFAGYYAQIIQASRKISLKQSSFL